MGNTASSRKKTGNTAASRKKKTDNAAPAKITGRTETGLFTPASREEKMDTAAKITAGRTETGLHTTPARYLTEDIYEEILLRLPAESVLRCRAVCKAWRRIATDPRFLAAHARRRPAQAVLYTYVPASSGSGGDDVALDLIPVSGHHRRHRLIRYPQLWEEGWKTNDAAAPRLFPPAMMPPRRVTMMGHCLMLASCDGVLLFKKDQGLYLLCNPVTRRWAKLPRLVDEIYHDVEYAFYFHRPTGEYRLLCGCCTWSGGDYLPWAWCVLSTGAAEPRRVDTHVVEAGLFVPCLLSITSQPAALHDRLHWAPYRDVFKGPTATTTMVTFDMVSETFRSMTGPPTSSALMKLFLMDGKIVVADFGKGNPIDLWVLEDYYGAQRWERRHQVVMPWGSGGGSMPEKPSCLFSVAALADDRGNVMLGNHYGLVVYNVRKNTARRVDSVATPQNNVIMSRHVFRESLVHLPCFNVPTTAGMPLIHFWN